MLSASAALLTAASSAVRIPRVALSVVWVDRMLSSAPWHRLYGWRNGCLICGDAAMKVEVAGCFGFGVNVVRSTNALRLVW